MISAGVDFFRLNFPHGAGKDHTAAVRMIRKITDREDRAVAILQDLQGPRIRAGALPAGDTVNLLPGQQFVLTSDPLPGGGNLDRVSVSFPGLPQDVSCRSGKF
jgi:pyruvate kinase